MKQDINNKTAKVKANVKQKGKVFLGWILTITYTVIVIYFVFKPLTEFVVRLDYYITFNLVNYFLK